MRFHSLTDFNVKPWVDEKWKLYQSQSVVYLSKSCYAVRSSMKKAKLFIWPHFNLFHFWVNFIGSILCFPFAPSSPRSERKIEIFWDRFSVESKRQESNNTECDIVSPSPSPSSTPRRVFRSRGRHRRHILFYFIYILCTHNSKHHIVNICALFNVLLILYFHHRSRTKLHRPNWKLICTLSIYLSLLSRRCHRSSGSSQHRNHPFMFGFFP